MLGELSGKIRSTPTPYEILRTVNVDRVPFETRRMHTPSKACRRVFSPSRIFAHTLTESPGRNSGRLAWRRCDFSMDSRIRCALMGTISGKSRLDAGFCQRSPLRVKPRDPIASPRVGELAAEVMPSQPPSLVSE